MKIKITKILILGLFLFGTVEIVGGVMISPQSVIYNSMDVLNPMYVNENMINHSGLRTNFISGVTELSTYLESNDTSHQIGAGSGWASRYTTSGDIIFDLGDIYEISTFLLWNDKDYQGINEFQLFIADESTFSNATFLGDFSAAYGGACYGSCTSMLQFSFDEAIGRYVKLHIFNIHEGSIYAQLAQIAEVAFVTVPPDMDDDGIANDLDNCPNVPNTDQANFDDDFEGNACDLDDDNDGFDDDLDNCQFDYNPEQHDFDGDGLGDFCDQDIDGDNVIDGVDECLETILWLVVNEKGCSVDQICPCDNNWKNHGSYMQCVAHTYKDFVDLGLITIDEKDVVVSQAAESSCGHKK